jgi:type IV pilus assembly protein PilP
MKKDLAPIRWIVCLLAAALVAACSDADQTAQTQVVRKKLVAQGQPAPKAAAPAPAQTTAAAVEIAQAKPPEPGPPTAPPKPKDHAPKPKDAPPPPTQAPPAAAVSVQPAQAAPAPLVVATAATAPGALPQPAPAAARPESATAVNDNPVAALLNIQAPLPYSAKNKADPFEPLLREEAAQAAAGKLTAKKRAPQSPLEKIDLGQLKLVAVIAASTGNRALVEEASGKGYILREGTFVGMNSGKVVGIGLDKITVEEEFEDVYGKTVLQKKEITLPKPPGEL